MSIGCSALGNAFPPSIFPVYEISGSLKSFVARHGINGTIASMCRENQTVEKKKGYECKATRFVWKFFDGKRARNQRAGAGRSRHYLWKEQERSLWNGGARAVRFYRHRRAVPVAERTPVAPLYPQGRFKAITIVVTTERHFNSKRRSESIGLAKDKKKETKERRRREKTRPLEV